MSQLALPIENGNTMDMFLIFNTATGGLSELSEPRKKRILNESVGVQAQVEVRYTSVQCPNLCSIFGALVKMRTGQI